MVSYHLTTGLGYRAVSLTQRFRRVGLGHIHHVGKPFPSSHTDVLEQSCQANGEWRCPRGPFLVSFYRLSTRYVQPCYASRRRRTGRQIPNQMETTRVMAAPPVMATGQLITSAATARGSAPR